MPLEMYREEHADDPALAELEKESDEQAKEDTASKPTPPDQPDENSEAPTSDEKEPDGENGGPKPDSK